MARKKKKYGASPITEAVYELFVKPRPELAWTPESALVIRDAFRGFTGRQETLQDMEMQVAVDKDQVQHGLRKKPPRYRWWHEEQQRALQAGANMCVHNVLPPYSKYEDYVETTGKLFKVYLQETDPEGVEWTGQRYINEIRVPANAPPKEYFAIYPAIQSIGVLHPKMALQVESANFKDGDTVTHLAFRRVDEEVAVYVLDIYARSSKQIEKSPSALLDWQARAHETISHSFELSITDKARAAFKEEQ